MKTLLLIPLTAFLAASPVNSQAKPAELKWMDGPASLPKGVQMAVVSGDPGKKGKFTIQLKMPADYAVPPHMHPTDEVVTMVSGELHYAMSDKMDMASAKTLKTGDSVDMKAKMNHWVHAAAPATVQVSAMGPFEITYANPKDDPRGTSASK
jgi:quercetin dioxygenase-like cupin family protein